VGTPSNIKGLTHAGLALFILPSEKLPESSASFTVLLITSYLNYHRSLTDKWSFLGISKDASA
jgi:hypothetical protein